MQIITIHLNTRDIDAYFYPAANGNDKAPGIIFLHDLTGLQEVNHKTAQIISEGGFNVLVPDLYSEMGIRKYCVRVFFDEMVRNNQPNGNEPLAEIMEIVDHFKAFDEVDGDNLGIVGQCLTGGFILHAAIRPEIKAPVVFHHSLGRKGSGIPSGCSALIQNKIQGHFVYLDPFCPAGRIKKLEEELGDKLEKYMYALPHGIPHLFFRNGQAKKAFERMMTFFQSQLK
ncbi:MAG: dienelactone hydrolase family protein [Bacteroidetes bacterium]|nr:dienelactone hydrolase family protein [Bacteroidota bacterium]